MDKIEYVPHARIDSACKRQERKNLKATGRSTSWVSMLHYIHDFVVEERTVENVCLMKVGWREKIKTL